MSTILFRRRHFDEPPLACKLTALDRSCNSTPKQPPIAAERQVPQGTAIRMDFRPPAISVANSDVSFQSAFRELEFLRLHCMSPASSFATCSISLINASKCWPPL